MSSGDSLIITSGATSLELLGFQASNGFGTHLVPGYDLGAAQPSTAEVISVLTDGSRIVGSRSLDRTITLPLCVIGSSRLDLAARVSALLVAVDQQAWTLTWTPGGGLPVVFDCFRGTPTVVNDLFVQDGLGQVVNVTFQALPFGRNPTRAGVSNTGIANQNRWRSVTLTPSGDARSPAYLDIEASSAATPAFLVHIAGPGSEDTAQVVFDLTTANPQVHTTDLTAAVFGPSTYTVMLAGPSAGSIAGTRTVTARLDVTLNGTVIATQTFTGGYTTTSASGFLPTSGTFLPLGAVTLPLITYLNPRLTPGTGTYQFVMTVTDTGSGTRTVWNDLLLLDTSGQYISSDSYALTPGTPFYGGGALAFQLNEPTALQTVGPTFWRTSSYLSPTVTKLQAPGVVISGGPPILDPNVTNSTRTGPPVLTAYTSGTSSPPIIRVQSTPRWQNERLS